MKKDIAIIGGGIGGVIAALTAAKMGKEVVLTEESEWIGGQLTSQAVPPDEHRWIEEFGCTKTYRRFRNRVREYYKENYPLKDEHKKNETLNPGNGWVSRIAHEPRVALAILYEFIQPYLSNGKIELLLNTIPIESNLDNDKVKNICVKNKVSEETMLIEAAYFLDATETGDLLPLTGVEYIVGAENKNETGEPNGLEIADPYDVQPITHVFALDFVEGGNHTIERPEMYDFWRSYQPQVLDGKNLLSEYFPDTDTKKAKYIPLHNKEGKLGLWEYRRVIDKNIYKDSFFLGDLSLINWPQNDYMLGTIIDVGEDVKAKRLEEAKQLSLSLLYWLQTEAPREGGKKGYPELRLRPDVTGTKDGLAMQPYIRESRRIKAHYTVTETDISKEIRGDKGIKYHKDSVGIGSYAMDLHPTTVTQRTFYSETNPFEIPLGSFIPIKIKNVLPACKNIGTTQLTNGCFRLHPVEWNIGEAAGALAAYAIDKKLNPVDIYKNDEIREMFQIQLEKIGIELHWPEDFK